MAKPETLGLMQSARVSTAGSGVRTSWTLLHSLSAFSLPQKCPEVLPGHLVHCSPRVRILGKIGPQNEHEAA